MKKLFAVVIAVGVMVVGLQAYGQFFSTSALGTVYPAPATASLTCYALDSDMQLRSVATRPDILAAFTNASSICFLRPPLADPNWVIQATPNPQPLPAPQPAPNPQWCPGYPTAPYPGMVCVNGGWQFNQ